jgi:hypothetical protein
MNCQRVFLIIAVLFMTLVTWLGRYEIVGEGNDGNAYRLDRWTGDIVYINQGLGGVVVIE